MAEINLMENYPKTKRDFNERAIQRTKEDIKIAREFGKDFFDGERRHGYGGYNYHPRFWKEVVNDFINHYKLTNNSKILDIGCAKGFMLYDFKKALPNIKVVGIDISQYAIANALKDIKPFVKVGDAKELGMFNDAEFDLIIAINTIHNLEKNDLKNSIKEIERIGKHAFIVLDAWHNEEEKDRMLNWNLTGRTLMHVDDWKKLFKEVNYTGDYYWFNP